MRWILDLVKMLGFEQHLSSNVVTYTNKTQCVALSHAVALYYCEVNFCLIGHFL